MQPHSSASGPIRAAIYARVSGKGQDAKHDDEPDFETSLDTQVSECLAYATAQGHYVDPQHIYREIWPTKLPLRTRPELTRLRALVQEGKVDRVLFFKMDRLGRSQGAVYILQEEWAERKVAMETPAGPYGVSATDKFLAGAQAFASEYWYERLVENTQSGRLRRAKAGLLPSAPRAKYGYCWADKTHGKFLRDPETAPVVEGIFHQAEAGVPLRAIAADLTERKVPTPKGGTLWCHTTVRGILADSSYTGDAATYRRQYHRHDNNRYTATLRPDDQVITLPEGTVPAIIDHATFAAVAVRLERNRRESARHCADPESALLRAGYARCGLCGRQMIYSTSVASYTHSRNYDPGAEACPAVGISLKASLVDGAAWGRVKVIMSDETIIAHEYSRLMESDSTDEEIARIDRAIAERTRKRANLIAQLEDLDPDTAEAVRQRLSGLSAELRALDAERAATLNDQVARHEAIQQVEAIQRHCREMAGRLDGLSYAQKRDVLATLKLVASIWPRDHKPRWEITTDLEGLLPSSIVSTATS